jgi:CheY-like chemotaxis protein
MDTLDPATIQLLLQRTGLVPQAQLDEVLEEMGSRNPPVNDLLRILERKSIITPWQSGKVLKGEKDGYFLGGYRILYKIASGSFGRVFRAEDSSTGRIVAIKVLRQRWSENASVIGSFEREGKVGLNLKHDNIVEVISISQDPTTKQYYIVMEFVEGGTLKDILAIRQKMSVAETLKIVEEATAGLAYAYSRGVTHRDVKVTNILISSQGTAKLVDFGLAQFYAGSNKEDDKKRMERTVDYAGLEKATGVKKGDVRSDIFFLGCVVYQMLTGESPIASTRDRSARQSALRFQQVPPLPADLHVPPAVVALVDTMLSLDAQRRFQTPSQLIEAIRKARGEIEGKAPGGTAAPRSLFVVERDEKLQDQLREAFKKLGYRVMISAEPTRALDRYRQQPFDALIVDAGTTGDDGRLAFSAILAEALTKQLSPAAVLILTKEQEDWIERVPRKKNVAILTFPINFKQLRKTLDDLFEATQ